MDATTTTAPPSREWVAPAWPQHDRSGCWLTDELGRSSLAFFCGGGVFNLGFRATDVAADVAALIQEHDIGLWSLPSERRGNGERGYARILPAPLTRSFFTTCAAEAFEVACKLAKRATGRKELVSVTRGYYGHLGYSLAMDDAVWSPDQFGPLAGGQKRAVFGSIESLEATVDDNTAAVCIESIQVPGGVNFAPDGYFQKVRALCDARGILLIVDEVQAGLMRTGRMWAISQYGVVPDLLIVGKGLSGGYYPVGAVSMREELYPRLFELPLVHRASYSGSELGARIAAMVAQRYLAPALAENVRARGAQLQAGLARLQAVYSDYLQPTLRGQGLLWAMDTRRVEDARVLIRACHAAGVFLKGSSVMKESVQFMPPLVISAAEVDEALTRIESALRSVAGG